MYREEKKLKLLNEFSKKSQMIQSGGSDEVWVDARCSFARLHAIIGRGRNW